MPVTKIAKTYGISNKAIRKKCKKLNISSLLLEYLLKVKHGYKPKVLSPEYLHLIKYQFYRYQFRHLSLFT